MSDYNVDKCPMPDCGSTAIIVPVSTWMTFRDGKPESFDQEDLGYAAPQVGGEPLCLACGHTWVTKRVAGNCTFEYRLVPENHVLQTFNAACGADDAAADEACAVSPPEPPAAA